MSMFHELMMRKKEQIMYATIKGTLTENDGVFSGFSSSNYLQIQNSVSITQSSNLEFYFKFTTPASFSYAGNYPVLCRLNNGNKVSMLGFYNSSGNIYARGSIAGNNIEDYSYTPQTNTTYYIKLTYANGVETLTLYDVDKNVLLTKSQSITITDVTETLYVGVTSGSHQGTMQSIDLNNSYIKLGSTKYNLQAVVGYTVVGSPTITDGVVSGFSATSYLTVPKPTTINKFELNIKFNFTSLSGYQYFFGDSVHNGIQLQKDEDGYIKMRYGNGDSSNRISIFNNLSTNTEYIVNVKVEGTNAIVTYNIEGQAETIQTFTLQYSPVFGSLAWILGKRRVDAEYGLAGSIDLNETYIKINNKLWFNGQQA